jgi:hypothetical protein
MFLGGFAAGLARLLAALLVVSSIANAGEAPEIEPQFNPDEWQCTPTICERREKTELAQFSGVFEGGANLHSSEGADRIAELREQGSREFKIFAPSQIRLGWDIEIDRDHVPPDWPADIGLGNTSVDIEVITDAGNETRVISQGEILPKGAEVTVRVRQQTYGLSGTYITYYPAKWKVVLHYAEIRERGITVYKDGSPSDYYKNMPLNKAEHPAMFYHRSGDVTIVMNSDGSAWVQTGEDGSGLMCLETGSCDNRCCYETRLGPNTRIFLHARNMVTSKTDHRLEKGTVFYRIIKQLTGGERPDPSYLIETPMSVVGVRGTVFDLEVFDNGSTMLKVTDGEVSLSPRVDGRWEPSETVIVPAGSRAAAVVRGGGTVQQVEIVGPEPLEPPSVSSLTGQPYSRWYEWQNEDGTPFDHDFPPPYVEEPLAAFVPPSVIMPVDGGPLLPSPGTGPSTGCVGAECREPDEEPSAFYDDGTPVLGDPVDPDAADAPVPPDDPTVRVGPDVECGADMLECRPPEGAMVADVTGDPAELTARAEDLLARVAGMDSGAQAAAAFPALADLTAAVGAGYAPAAMALGYVHEAGLGVPQDFDRSVAYYAQAGKLGLQQGFEDAMMLADQTGRDTALVQVFLAYYQAMPYEGLTRLIALSHEARVTLQRFLKEAGTYTGALDGAFGDGSVAALDVYLDGAASVATPVPDLAAALQTELRRVGCYDMVIDGDWGGNSARALENFNRWTGQSLPTDRATEAALATVRATPGPVCGVD